MMRHKAACGSGVFRRNKIDVAQYFYCTKRKIIGMADRGSDDMQRAGVRSATKAEQFPVRLSPAARLTPVFLHRYNSIFSNRQIVLKI